MKGIILAGGTGSRLHPVTLAISKQLLAVYNKPMVYYPLSTLMLAGLTELLIITTPADRQLFERMLRDGRHLGLRISYAEQAEPKGIAEALIIAEDFLDGDSCALILGDNLFYGHGMQDLLRRYSTLTDGAAIFCSQVHDPQRYGVVSFDPDGKPVDIIEKPAKPLSNYAVSGLYFYDPSASARARRLVPSGRNELEITAINRSYLDDGTLEAVKLGRGIAWFDTGTFDSMMRASNFVQTLEERQGLLVGCPEEISYRLGYISAAEMRELAKPLLASGYGEYLLDLIRDGEDDA